MDSLVPSRRVEGPKDLEKMQDDLSQPATCIGVAARAAVRLLEQRGVDPARIRARRG